MGDKKVSTVVCRICGERKVKKISAKIQGYFDHIIGIEKEIK